MFPFKPTSRLFPESFSLPAFAAAAAFVALPLGATTAVHGQVTVAQALQYSPVQKGVDYDVPAAKVVEKCNVKQVKAANGAQGFVVTGAGGQTLRQFDDTNKDGRVDQWCYFKNGIESYRDLDSNFNGKADQHRWLGVGGTKWGVDRNEDGEIDSWKEISPEEVSAELVAAVRDQDVERFATVLLKPTEVASLGLGPEASKKISERVATAARRFQASVGAQKLVSANSQWVHFSATKPSVLPAGTSGATQDVYIYENVSAMLDKGQLPVGTLVKANGQWKAIDIPMGLMPQAEQNEFGSFLLTPAIGLPKDPPLEGLDPETQKLVKELQDNDVLIRQEKSPAKRDTIYDRQVAILRDLATRQKAPDQQEIWIKQLAETLAASVQSGEYSRGFAQLDKLHSELDKQAKGQPLTGYVRYRLLDAEYANKLKNPKADFPAIQKWWVKNLEDYVTVYKSGPDFTTATLQLATAEELDDNDKVAIKHYEAIVSRGEGELEIRKAKGAVKRLSSTGRPLTFSGRSLIDPTKTVSLAQYKGRYVLVHFWATWMDRKVLDPEMKAISRMKAIYGKDFDAIGVNVDTDVNEIKKFFAANGPKWQHIYEEGGFDGNPAADLGVPTVPLALLIDPKGVVVSSDATVGETQKVLEKAFNK